jgi:hypothetical protein
MKTILTILLTALALPAHAVSIVPEPETIFYGKILNRSGPQPYQMTRSFSPTRTGLTRIGSPSPTPPSRSILKSIPTPFPSVQAEPPTSTSPSR